MRQDKISEPFEQISPELWLMLASAGGDINKAQSLLQQPVNWDWLLKLADHHRVYPLVYKTLNQLNNPAIPQHVLDLLQQKCWQNAILAINMSQETIRMAKCFESHGILAIVLKGAPLAWRLYGDITIRPSSDIDILVPFEELEKAISILETEGYTEKQNLTSRQLQIYLKTNKRNSYHLTYRHNKTNICLELHWKISSAGFHSLFTPTENIIRKIKVEGSSLPVLLEEEWLLYLILHGAKHGWSYLRWLVDIAEFTQKKGLDWNKISFLAKNFGLESILHQSLILANRFLATPIPLDISSKVNNDRSAWRLAYSAMDLCLSTADSEILGDKKQRLKYLQNNYYSLLWPGWKNRNRFNYVSKIFKPTLYEIKLISLPNRVYVLYYFIRPCYWVWRRLLYPCKFC
ncbi:MAG TPA: hypothetical protein DEF34_05000 [Desulfotomaculum sp.]|nr:MAG: hypothetical protein JL56_15645 [Desulfotomaculum sp. BICA1-6]HBX22975.1 hypothetical protein [Desulfotomaculum sp.]